MAAPSRVLLLPACPGPALPALLLPSHGIHTHWYFSKAVYRASQRFWVVAGITVVRASQYSESFESSRTTFSNFTGTQKSLKVKSTGIIPLNLVSPGPPSSAPHRLSVTFIRSWKSLRNNTCLSIKVPDSRCCCHRYEGVSSTPFLSISLPYWLYSSLLCPFLPRMQQRQLLKFVIFSPHTTLQYSCLENPMDRGAWKAAVHGVAEGQTRLSGFTFSFHFHALEKEMQPTPVSLPGESQGWGSLVGCHLWGHRVEHD